MDKRLQKTIGKDDIISLHSDAADDCPRLVCASEDQDPSTATPMLSVYQSRGNYEGFPPCTLPLKIRLG